MQEPSTCGWWGEVSRGQTLLLQLQRLLSFHLPSHHLLRRLQGRGGLQGSLLGQSRWKGPAASILLDTGQTAAVCPSALLTAHWIIHCVEYHGEGAGSQLHTLPRRLACNDKGSAAVRSSELTSCLSPSLEGHLNKQMLPGAGLSPSWGPSFRSEMFFLGALRGEKPEESLLPRAPGPSPPPAPLNPFQISQLCRLPDLACCRPN